MLLFALKIAIVVTLLSTLFQYVGKFFLNYKIQNKQLSFVIFHFFSIYSIPIDNEMEFFELSVKEAIRPDFSRFNLSNRFAGRMIIIQRKNAKIKKIAITPEHTESFLRELRGEQLKVFPQK